jgi:hypothetical protein
MQIQIIGLASGVNPARFLVASLMVKHLTRAFGSKESIRAFELPSAQILVQADWLALFFNVFPR